MFYKFIGGSNEVLLNTFEVAVRGGSLKFGSAGLFNDPFEFKFVSVAPTKSQFDAWHEIYERHRTPTELANAWESLTGPAAHWNTTLQPRFNILERMYVLCLAQRWDSHLMWAHYCSSHHGFVIRYRPEIINVLRSRDGFLASRNVIYRKGVPELRWFNSLQDVQMEILFSKSQEWQYEGEHRVVFHGNAENEAIYCTIDPSLIDGVIFGTRASGELITRALALQATCPALKVEQVSSDANSYQMVTKALFTNVYPMSGIL